MEERSCIRESIVLLGKSDLVEQMMLEVVMVMVLLDGMGVLGILLVVKFVS